MNSGRRRALRTGARWAAVAGAATIADRIGLAQGPTGPVRRPDRYDEDVLFADRRPFTWPGGATVAVWVIPNVEIFVLDPAAGAPGTTPGDQDVLNYSVRDYGMRVGLWRVAEAMDALGIRGTVALNAAVCEVFPTAIAELVRRGWEMMGHNVTNSRTLRNTTRDQEQAIVHTTLKVIEQSTGRKVRGWLGTGLAETFDTLDVLAAAGVQYTGDWNNDDLPVPMKVRGGTMHGLPYGNEVNDIRFFQTGHTGEEYARMLIDQFDTLYAESRTRPRVMGIPLHPFHVGQPLRIKYFRQAIEHMKTRDRVWFTTGSEILDAYLAAQTPRGARR
jgi:peptidoglycan/xylan/chitin deacetylase (PgdA/CDA1 family)